MIPPSLCSFNLWMGCKPMMTRAAAAAAWKILTSDAAICKISAFKLLNHLLNSKSGPSAGTLYLKKDV